MHKIVFNCHTPQASYFEVFFAHFFVLLLFLCVPLFLENHSIASQKFYTDVRGITERFTSLKKPFRRIDASAGSPFEVFWGFILEYPHLFLRAAPDVFCISLRVNVLRNILHLVFGGH